jgi:hypothetical protein
MRVNCGSKFSFTSSAALAVSGRIGGSALAASRAARASQSTGAKKACSRTCGGGASGVHCGK